MKDKLKEIVAIELKKSRIDNGETLLEVSENTGLSKDLISRYENGGTIQMDSLAILLEHYKTNFVIFFQNVYTKMYNNLN